MEARINVTQINTLAYLALPRLGAHVAYNDVVGNSFFETTADGPLLLALQELIELTNFTVYAYSTFFFCQRLTLFKVTLKISDVVWIQASVSGSILRETASY